MPNPELTRDTSLEDGRMSIANALEQEGANKTTFITNSQNLAPKFGGNNLLPPVAPYESITLSFGETMGDVLCTFPDSSYNDWLKANPHINLKKIKPTDALILPITAKRNSPEKLPKKKIAVKKNNPVATQNYSWQNSNSTSANSEVRPQENPEYAITYTLPSLTKEKPEGWIKAYKEPQKPFEEWTFEEWTYFVAFQYWDATNIDMNPDKNQIEIHEDETGRLAFDFYKKSTTPQEYKDGKMMMAYFDPEILELVFTPIAVSGGLVPIRVRPQFLKSPTRILKNTKVSKIPIKKAERPTKTDPANVDANIKRNDKGELNQVDGLYLAAAEKTYLKKFISKGYKLPPDVEFIRQYRDLVSRYTKETVNSWITGTSGFAYDIQALQNCIQKANSLNIDVKEFVTWAIYPCVNKNLVELERFVNIAGRDISKINIILDNTNACGGNFLAFKKHVDTLHFFKKTPISTQKPNIAGTSFHDVNMQHILDKHSLEHFIFANNPLGEPIDFFPIGTTQADVCLWIEEALQILNHSNPSPSLPLHGRSQIVALSNGMSVEIGSNIGSAIQKGAKFPANQSIIGQFYPVKNTGKSVSIGDNGELLNYKKILNE